MKKLQILSLSIFLLFALTSTAHALTHSDVNLLIEENIIQEDSEEENVARMLVASITQKVLVGSLATSEEEYNQQMSQDYEESLEQYVEEYLNNNDDVDYYKEVYEEWMESEAEEMESELQKQIEEAERVIQEEQEAYEAAHKNKKTNKTIYTLPASVIPTDAQDNDSEVEVSSIEELLDQELVDLLALVLSEEELERALLAIESILNSGTTIGVSNTGFSVPRDYVRTLFTTEKFKEALQIKVRNDLGQPIEGYEPSMFKTVFSGLKDSDFDEVEAMIGRYVLSDSGNIEYDDENAEMLHSAAGAISQSGYGTLLKNILERSGFGSAVNLNDVIQFISN